MVNKSVSGTQGPSEHTGEGEAFLASPPGIWTPKCLVDKLVTMPITLYRLLPCVYNILGLVSSRTRFPVVVQELGLSFVINIQVSGVIVETGL